MPRMRRPQDLLGYRRRCRSGRSKLTGNELPQAAQGEQEENGLEDYKLYLEDSKAETVEIVELAVVHTNLFYRRKEICALHIPTNAHLATVGWPEQRTNLARLIRRLRLAIHFHYTTSPVRLSRWKIRREHRRPRGAAVLRVRERLVDFNRVRGTLAKRSTFEWRSSAVQSNP